MKTSIMTAAAGFAFSTMLVGGLASAQEKKEGKHEVPYGEEYPGDCDKLPKYDPETTVETDFIEEVQKMLETEVISDPSISDAGQAILDREEEEDLLAKLWTVCPYPAPKSKETDKKEKADVEG